MLKVGIAGIGFMGWIHWLAYQKIEDVQVAAICDLDTNRLAGDWTGIKGNFGPPGTKVDLSGVQCCNNLDEFCQLDFDLLDICLPPDLHVTMIQRAARCGKHVFCEKPLALDLQKCDEAVAACSAANTILQVGHVLPFFPEFQAALKIINSGDYGHLKIGHFKRIISDPVWLKHYYDPKKIGGPLMDLHVHDAHFIRLIAGMPSGVYSRGEFKNEVVSFCHSIFDFSDANTTIASSSGVINQQGRPFTHGFEIQLEKATLHFEYAAVATGDESMPLKIITDDGKVQLIELDSNDPVDAFIAEVREMVEHVQQGKPSKILDGKLARDAIQICQAEAKSVKQRERIGLDSE